MSISSNLFTKVCEFVTNIITNTPDLDDETRKNLTKKVHQLAMTVLEDALKNLGATHENSIRFLIYAIEEKILEGSPKETSEKIFIFTEPLLKKIRFATDLNENLTLFETTDSKKLGSDKSTYNIFSNTFRDALWSEYQILYGPESVINELREFRTDLLDAIFCYQEIFESALEVAIESEESTNKAYLIFIKTMRDEIKKINHEEEITREIFYQLAGRALGGRGRPLFNLKDPHVAKLLEEYKSGIWKDGETRHLRITKISDEENQRLRKAFENIILGNNLEHALLKFIAEQKEL